MTRFRFAMPALIVSTLSVIPASAGARMLHATAMTSLKATAKTAQHFTTALGNWECTRASALSGLAALKGLLQRISIQYSGCVAFGVLLTASPAEYELSADNGVVKLIGTITLKGTACVLVIPGNQLLTSVGYKNSGAEAVFEPSFTGLESEGTGALCSYSREHNGAYAGSLSLGVTGGTVEWSESGGAGEGVSDWGGVRFTDAEDPFSVSTLKTAFHTLKFTGFGRSGTLKVNVSGGFADENSPCNGQSIPALSSCDVRLLCTSPKATGVVTVKSSLPEVWDTSRKLTCA